MKDWMRCDDLSVFEWQRKVHISWARVRQVEFHFSHDLQFPVTGRYTFLNFAVFLNSVRTVYVVSDKAQRVFKGLSID